MEQAEQPTTREFDSLNESEKVQAILGAIKRPVTKPFAIELSGVDYKSLGDEEKEKVDAVFGGSGIEVTEESGENKYRLGDDEREKLGTTVVMKSVHRAILNELL